MPMDSEMNDISLSDFTPYTIVASLEMSDEPNENPSAHVPRKKARGAL